MFIPADDEALLREAAHGLVAAPHRADGTDGFHGENRRVATNNNNNKESRFGVRTEVGRSSCGLQEKATVL